MRATVLIATLLCFAFTCDGQAPADDVQLTHLFEVDQAARHAKSIDWTKLNAEDAARRNEVHRMLDSGEVRTGNDYFHAALIYQQGEERDDFLLAHVLAVGAMALGNKDARWLSAATLDRYLVAMSQPQIDGTQFESSAGKSSSWAQRTMDPSLISDSMRSVVCVVPVAEQKKILDTVHQGGTFQSTKIANCP